MGARGERRGPAEHAGGDFLLDVGQDLAVGYLTHDVEQVDLYLEESLRSAS